MKTIEFSEDEIAMLQCVLGKILLGLLERRINVIAPEDYSMWEKLFEKVTCKPFNIS